MRYAAATGDRRCTLSAWYKDAAGNVSTIAAASILLDQTAPTNGTLTPTAASTQITLNWAGFTDAGSGLATRSEDHTSELQSGLLIVCARLPQKLHDNALGVT